MTDKSELLNEAEIDFLLKSAGNDEAAAAPASRVRTVTMRGDLQQINLADIFQTLAMAKMEGVLRLCNPLEDREVYCRDGHVQLLVPSRTATRRLGQRMIQAGLLTADQLRTALIAQRKIKLPIGELLVQEGLVTHEQVEEIVGMQIAEDLFGLFTWQRGTFEFYKHEGSGDGAAAFAGCPEFEVNSLLLEVARRSDEWESIFAAIRSLDEVPERIAEPADDAELSDVHQALLGSVDGTSTYRDLADHTTYGLFEAARAARDLVAGGICGNVDDAGLVDAANAAVTANQNKKAVLLLQTLRDRPGDRALGVLQAMAATMQQAGEKRLGGQLLLEAAQRQPAGETALELARAAQALAGHDPEVLSFLRTVLIAHGAPDSPELEACTVELLDALIDADQLGAAIDIIDDARRTGTMRPQILVREARARQKHRDLTGAAEALFELGKHYEDQGDRPRALETYHSLLRVDRSRKDVQKLVTALQRTRLGNIVRLCATIAAVLMLGAMGFVLWQQHSFDSQVAEADAEISALLATGDRSAAAARLADWQRRLGDCEPVDDLRSRVAFAEAAEHTRQQKELRLLVNEQLTNAAALLGRGELEQALRIYGDLWQRPSLQDEITKIVDSRFEVLLTTLEQTAKALANNLPPAPDTLFDRKLLTTHLADLQAVCPPATLRLFADLQRLQEAARLPECLAEAPRQRITTLVERAATTFQRTALLAAAYTAALQRNDEQRQLDPMFKAAVAREGEYDFAGALELYRELEKQPSNDAELRAHFRDRVARNATIVKLTSALKAAAERGDFDAAQQQLRALRLSYPDVPFGRIVRLPLRVTSEPNGAAVTCNGAAVGRTPLLLLRVPEQPTRLEVALEGFTGQAIEIADDTTPAWVAHLVLGADQQWKHGSAIDVPPAIDAAGTLFVVDRSGTVTARAADGSPRGTYRSEDLSGLLTAPRVFGDLVLVASLDGDLRALDTKTGAVRWTLAGLPTETAPQLVADKLVLATNDGHLRGVDLGRQQALDIVMPEATRSGLLVRGSRIVVLGQKGTVMAFDLPDLQRAWTRGTGTFGHASGVIAGNLLLLGNDHGGLLALDLDSGEPRWQRDLELEILGAPIVTGQGLVVATPGALIELHPDDGHELRRLPRPEQDWAGAPAQLGNRIVLALRDGTLQVVDASTLAPSYRLRAPRRSRCLAFDGALLVVAPDHAVSWFRSLR
ncbi:MAG: PQQ-binding-like beta-propeller repeat protein [Planctomycetes bacterium]|nr:PQQ-binding-like beta-propeller repeat protein [Planctomycetota bacterium]